MPASAAGDGRERAATKDEHRVGLLQDSAALMADGGHEGCCWMSCSKGRIALGCWFRDLGLEMPSTRCPDLDDVELAVADCPCWRTPSLCSAESLHHESLTFMCLSPLTIPFQAAFSALFTLPSSTPPSHSKHALISSTSLPSTET